jgi:hypothetical protein
MVLKTLQSGLLSSIGCVAIPLFTKWRHGWSKLSNCRHSLWLHGECAWHVALGHDVHHLCTGDVHLASVSMQTLIVAGQAPLKPLKGNGLHCYSLSQCTQQLPKFLVRSIVTTTVTTMEIFLPCSITVDLIKTKSGTVGLSQPKVVSVHTFHTRRHKQHKQCNFRFIRHISLLSLPSCLLTQWCMSTTTYARPWG